MTRILPFLKESSRLWREAGFRPAFSHLGKRVYPQNENLFYELRTAGFEPELPNGWRVMVVASKDDASAGLLLKPDA